MIILEICPSGCLVRGTHSHAVLSPDEVEVITAYDREMERLAEMRGQG